MLLAPYLFISARRGDFVDSYNFISASFCAIPFSFLAIFKTVSSSRTKTVLDEPSSQTEPMCSKQYDSKSSKDLRLSRSSNLNDSFAASNKILYCASVKYILFLIDSKKIALLISYKYLKPLEFIMNKCFFYTDNKSMKRENYKQWHYL